MARPTPATLPEPPRQPVEPDGTDPEGGEAGSGPAEQPEDRSPAAPTDPADATAPADPTGPAGPAGPADPGDVPTATVVEAHHTTGRDGSEPGTGRWPRGELSRWASWAVGVGLGVVALGVYLRSLLPGTGYSGDTAKWQFLGVVGGVPHATGYPFFVALDQAFMTLVPWGSPAWRANLFSALLGAATVVAVYRLLRILDVRWGVAAATALTFAFTTTFWSQAVVAEVYTLHLLLLVTVTVCLARWRTGAANAWLLVGLGLYGLSLAHHATAALALPGVIWLVWGDWRRALTRTHVLVLVVAGVVVASQYLYLPYMSRVGGYVEHPIENVGDVLDYLTGGSFRRDLFTFGPSEVLHHRVPLVWRFVWDEYGVLLLPAAYGVWRGLRQADRVRRDVAVHVVLLALCGGVFVLNYDVVDLIVFCLPLFLALAVLVGLGLEGVAAWLTTHVPRPAGRPWATRALAGAGVAALVAVPAVTGLADYRRASQRGNVDDAARVERALDVADRHAVILTDDYHESMYVLYYLLGEGMQESHDLVLAREVTPSAVVAHLKGQGGPVAEAARRVDGPVDGRRRQDPPLYTAVRRQAAQLTDAGVELTEVAEDVWRVDGLG